MGFLSNILNPKHALRALVDPAGATISAIKGTNPLSARSLVDPGGFTGSSHGGSPNAAAGTQTAAAADPMADYYGDTNDPEYGSLTHPFDVEQFYNYADPGYAFQLQQGNQALQNSAAAGSGALSGAALKDLIGYNQQFAGSAYNDAFNRYQTQTGNIYERLMGVSQLGQNAAAGVGASGVALAGNAGQAMSNAGAAYGAGMVGAGNALANAGTNYWLYKNPQLWSGSKGGG